MESISIEGPPLAKRSSRATSIVPPDFPRFLVERSQTDPGLKRGKVSNWSVSRECEHLAASRGPGRHWSYAMDLYSIKTAGPDLLGRVRFWEEALPRYKLNL